MAKIKNQSGTDLTLPWLGDRLVLAGQVVEVPDADVYAYTQQSVWDPSDKDAKAIHNAEDQPEENDNPTEEQA